MFNTIGLHGFCFFKLFLMGGKELRCGFGHTPLYKQFYVHIAACNIKAWVGDETMAQKVFLPVESSEQWKIQIDNKWVWPIPPLPRVCCGRCRELCPPDQRAQVLRGDCPRSEGPAEPAGETGGRRQILLVNRNQNLVIGAPYTCTVVPFFIHAI